MNEIKLNITQFSVFNERDQFQLFTDEDGFPDYEDLEDEIENLFKKYDHIVVTENDYIYGVTNNNREVLSDMADEGYQIALEVIQDIK